MPVGQASPLELPGLSVPGLLPSLASHPWRLPPSLLSRQVFPGIEPPWGLHLSGDRKERTEYISLADEFFEGQKTFLDAKIKVLYGSGQGDIISQYVTFTKVYDEQRKLHGRTRKAVTETIRICKDKNVLKEYLEEREKEVENIMLAMYDEKEILREYIESERYDTEKEMAVQLLKEGLSVEQIARCSSALSVDEVRMLQEELAQSV